MPPEEEEHGLHKSIDRDVQEMFTGKSSAELGTVEEEVKDTLRRGGAGTDAEYWEAVLKRLRVWKAKARVRELNGALRDRFAAERREAGEEPPPESEPESDGEPGGESDGGEERAAGAGAGAGKGKAEWDYPARAGSPMRSAEESDGRFSPTRVPVDEDAASSLESAPPYRTHRTHADILGKWKAQIPALLRDMGGSDGGVRVHGDFVSSLRAFCLLL